MDLGGQDQLTEFDRARKFAGIGKLLIVINIGTALGVGRIRKYRTNDITRHVLSSASIAGQHRQLELYLKLNKTIRMTMNLAFLSFPLCAAM